MAFHITVGGTIQENDLNSQQEDRITRFSVFFPMSMDTKNSILELSVVDSHGNIYRYTMPKHLQVHHAETFTGIPC